MNRVERKELNAVLDMLLDDEGDHFIALERLCVLAGRRVRPIVAGAPVTALEASVEKNERKFRPAG